MDFPHLPASASVVPLMMDLVPQFELTAGAGCRLQATTGWRVLWLPETTLFYPHLYWRAVDLRLRGSRVKDEVGFGGVSDEVRSEVSSLRCWCCAADPLNQKPLIFLFCWCCTTADENDVEKEEQSCNKTFYTFSSATTNTVSSSYSSSSSTLVKRWWRWTPPPRSNMVIIIESGSLWDSILGVRKMKKRSWVWKKNKTFLALWTLHFSSLFSNFCLFSSFPSTFLFKYYYSGAFGQGNSVCGPTMGSDPIPPL